MGDSATVLVTSWRLCGPIETRRPRYEPSVVHQSHKKFATSHKNFATSEAATRRQNTSNDIGTRELFEVLSVTCRATVVRRRVKIPRLIVSVVSSMRSTRSKYRFPSQAGQQAFTSFLGTCPDASLRLRPIPRPEIDLEVAPAIRLAYPVQPAVQVTGLGSVHTSVFSFLLEGLAPTGLGRERGIVESSPPVHGLVYRGSSICVEFR